MGRYCPECDTRFEDESLQICPHDGTSLYRMGKDDGEEALIGAVIDRRFRIDSTLGQGGMGTVYRGVQLSVGRDVAIKVLRPDMANQQIALERFFREAKTISNLSHPNIVRLIDFGQDPDRDILYLVMELVDGFDLGDLLQKGRLRMSVALDILYQACGALTEPHATGIIHRDLKPDNILIVPMSDGTIQTKVLDFGIARALEQNTQITATGMICGTPAYMAPEQAQNSELDPRADLYSLGVIFYEMLSGWPPFSGTSSLQIMLKHVQEAPAPLRDLLPPASLIPQVEELAAELMKKEADTRPKSARNIRERIDAIRREVHLEQVRVEKHMDLDDVVKAWLLPKLPRGDGAKSGPTEMLRRETGLEPWVSDTQLEPGLNDKTIPIKKQSTPVPTWKGAQQAWTPAGQQAVQRIKSTNNLDSPDMGEVIAFDETGLLEPSEAAPRKTMVEDSLSQIDSEPSQSTGERRPVTGADIQPAKKPLTITNERPVDATEEHRRSTVMPPSQQSSDRPLLVVAILLGIVALFGATAIVYLLTQDKQPPPAPIRETPQISSAEPSVAPAPANPSSMGVVSELSQAKVSASIREGLIVAQEAGQKLAGEASKSAKTKKRSKKNITAAKVVPTKKAPKKEPKKNEITEDDVFGGRD